MFDVIKFSKLLQRFEKISTELQARQDFTIHRHVNHSYYMQRVEEMKILLEQLEEVEHKLEILRGRLQEHYVISFEQWYRDARWLTRHLHHSNVTNSTC